MLVGPSPRARGGISQFNAELARQLLDAGAEAKILAYRRVYPLFSRAGRQGADPSARRTDIASDPVLVPWYPWTWARGASALARQRPQVVVIQWWHPITALSTWYLARRARRLGARVIVVCHNAWPHEGFPLARRLTQLALGTADSLIALSDAVAEDLRSIHPGASVSIIAHPPYSLLTGDADPTSVENWRTRIAAPADAKIVLFFGNVRPYKGLGDLVDAFPRVIETTPAVLVVAGTFFESLGLYRARVRDIGIAGSIRLFDEYVPNEDVAALFSLSDLIVLPYRSASQSGVIPLAAMFGKPVVTTRVGALPEALAGSGALVAPNDPEGLGAAIAGALAHPPSPPPIQVGLWHRWRDAVLSP